MGNAISFQKFYKSKKITKLVHITIIISSLLVIFIVGPYLFYNINFLGKIYPNIYVEGTNIGGLTNEQAISVISNKVAFPQKIKLRYQDKNYEIDTTEIGLMYDYSGTAERAYNLVRTGNIFFDLYQRFNLLFHPISIGYLIKVDEAKLDESILQIASQINVRPIEAKFTFDGKRVLEFQTSSNGISVDQGIVKDKIIKGFSEFTIPTQLAYPNITTDKINNLGVKELIGHGNSTYFHSIPGRSFNVNLAASRINGTLVAPGDTFSFNQTLGDVSKFTGYQQAYIISGGKTILGDGGGVCQVSTTLFRAVMNAGLPVTDRSAHAYRVGYYEQGSPPGLDATIYYPITDFKFTNDTGNYVLIQAKNDSANYSLVFDIYGTNDGRVSEISKPVVSNYSAPLPTVYQDDPTLPIGTLKQTDFAAAGARVTFNYTVTKNGENIFQKTFISNYQPWAAVYLRGIATK